jgi:hypothetical protein
MTTCNNTTRSSTYHSNAHYAHHAVRRALPTSAALGRRGVQFRVKGVEDGVAGANGHLPAPPTAAAAAGTRGSGTSTSGSGLLLLLLLLQTALPPPFVAVAILFYKYKCIYKCIGAGIVV